MAVNDMVMGAAGAASASGPAVYIEDVFSTYLYTGTGATRTITNGIDLSTSGGMVWFKSMSSAVNHQIFDTTRGVLNPIQPNLGDGQSTDTAASLTAFNTSGFSLGSWGGVNTSSANYASWTFRKQPKFFDIVTYTGNGDFTRVVSHALGSAPGCVIVKRTDGTQHWGTYHRGGGAGNDVTGMSFNTDAAPIIPNIGVASDFNASTIRPGFVFDSNGGSMNVNGATYVAYLFAHNAGGFGATGTDNVISCGIYTGNGSATGPEITLGYEPQWVLIKKISDVANWVMSDTMRNWSEINAALLYANLTNAEATNTSTKPTATGFQINDTSSSVNTNGSTYMYIAIRRPMKVPTDATTVFGSETWTSTDTEPVSITSGFPVDMALYKPITTSSGMDYKWRMVNRLIGVGKAGTNSGSELVTNSGTGEGYPNSVSAYNSSFQSLASMTKVIIGYLLNRTDDNGNVNYIGYHFKRAAGFFDVVAYTANGYFPRTVSHALGTAPGCVIVKRRDTDQHWGTYHRGDGVSYDSTGMSFNTDAAAVIPNIGVIAEFNASTIRPGLIFDSNGGSMNVNGATYVAYLFATCAGVSKVSYYTGNGSSQTINCGFTAGARFIMIKRVDGVGSWYIWDSTRGIGTGNDPHLSLNTTTAQVTTNDTIDPDNSGFIVNQLSATNVNITSAKYIFIAIA